MSQKDLAKQFGIPSKTLYDIECALKKASLKMLLKLSEILHVTVDMLLEGTLSLKANAVAYSDDVKLFKINKLLATSTLRKKLSFSKILGLYHKIHQ